MSYAKALAAIEALPRKVLVKGKYYSPAADCHCAVGVLFPALRGRENVSSLVDHGDISPVMLVEWGLSLPELVRLQRETDRAVDYGEDDADRYDRVLTWLREQVAAETAHVR